MNAATLGHWIARVRRYWNDAHSPHRRIAVSALTVAAFIFLARVAGAIKEIVIAWRYGTGPEIDAYIYVFNLYNLLPSVWSSVAGAVLIPSLVQRAVEDQRSSDNFRGNTFGLALAVAVVFTPISWGIAQGLLSVSWGGLHVGPTRTAAEEIANTMLLMVPLMVFTGLYSTWWMAKGGHRNTLFEAVPSVVLAAVLIAPIASGGDVLIVGTLLGVTTQLLLLGGSIYRRGLWVRPQFQWFVRDWRPIWRSLGIMTLGQTILSLSGIIDTVITAQFDTGSIAAFGYASRVTSLALSVCAIAVGRAALPVLSELAVHDVKEWHGVVRRWSLWLFAAGGLAAACGWVLGPWVISLLFERGAFTAQDTENVAVLLRILLWQLPFYLPGIVLAYAMASRGRHDLMLATTVPMLCVKMFVVWMGMSYGVIIVALSCVVMYIASALVLLLLYWRISDGPR